MLHYNAHILSIQAYKPPLVGRVSGGDHLLDFNERDEPLPQVILDTLAEWVRRGNSIRYPDYTGFGEELERSTGQPISRLFWGNGSDQLIECMMRIVVKPGARVLLPAPSFAMYDLYARLVDAHVATYSMLESDPFEQMGLKLKEKATELVIICNPNNPTGHPFDHQRILDRVRSHPHTWFLVDEAYSEFARSSLLDAKEPFPDNLVLTKTFSKAYGLAALRLGFMVASEPFIEQLLKVRGPYDVNQFAVEAGKLVLRHRAMVLEYVQLVMDVHKPKVEELLRRKQIGFFESSANFILLREAQPELEQVLKRHRVRYRPMSAAGIRGQIRLSIGGKSSTEALLKALREFK